jgi:hypothetical protein
MDLLNVLMITFSVVAANHLGLVSAIERTVKHRLPIINCPKCMTFWTVLVYGMAADSDHFVGISELVSADYFENILELIAVALLAAWAAIWLELFMGFIDQLYLKAYEQIYPTADSTDADA